MPEMFVADIAAEWHFAGVGSHMLLQLTSLGKRPLADLARERPFSGVRLFVPFQLI